MQKYVNSYGEIPTNQNNYNIIANNNYINGNNANNINKIKTKKKVKINPNVEIYNIESYKELNKLLTYDEEEGIRELLKDDPNFKIYNDYARHNSQKSDNSKTKSKASTYDPFGNFANPNARRKNVKPECCCLL